jgi:FtsZ-binding cell division protein ZapB
MNNNILITLDYELFFGSKVGTLENCILHPTNRLIDILDRYNVKATFFVDSGYLVRLEEQKKKYPILENEYQKITNQIEALDKNGHNIQLHIHPHWEDSYFDGSHWVMNTKRYRLHEFSEPEIDDIVFRYKKVLTNIVGDKIFAHRAGGWCMQPFDKLKSAFKKHNIWLDSTVFENGMNNSKTHFFDFRNSPKKANWNFEDDPLIVKKDGFFKEFPISAYKVSPLFFWKLVFFKKFGSKEHNTFGDGTAAGGSKKDKLRMLTGFTNSVVSIDGYKSSFLQDAYNSFLKKNSSNDFIIIGHPKAMSEYSLKEVEKFIKKNNSSNFITVGELKK